MREAHPSTARFRHPPRIHSRTDCHAMIRIESIASLRLCVCVSLSCFRFFSVSLDEAAWHDDTKGAWFGWRIAMPFARRSHGDGAAFVLDLQDHGAGTHGLS